MGLPPHDPFEPQPFPGVSADRGISCLTCEYDLTGLAEDGDCPECGRPIAHSTERARLRGAPVETLRHVHRGLRLVFWIIILSMLSGVFVAIIAMFLTQSVGASQVVGTLVGLLLSVVNLYAWHILMTPIPTMSDADRTRAIRNWLLILLTVALLGTAVQGALSANITSGAPLGIPAMIAVPLSIFVSIVGVAVYFFQVAYLRRLADFVPDRRLAQRFKTLFLVLCIGVPIYLLATIAVIVSAVSSLPSPGGSPGGGAPGATFATGGLMLAGFAMCGASVGALVFYVMYLVGLYQLGSRARDALAIAERQANHDAFATHPR